MAQDLFARSIAAPFALPGHALQSGIGQFFEDPEPLEPDYALTMKQNGVP